MTKTQSCAHCQAFIFPPEVQTTSHLNRFFLRTSDRSERRQRQHFSQWLLPEQTRNPSRDQPEPKKKSFKRNFSPAEPRGGQRGRQGSGAGGRGPFEDPDLAAVAHQEGHGHHGDADAHGGEELVHGVGQHEGAGASCHPGLQGGLTEAQLQQHHAHVHATAGTGDVTLG